MNINFPTRSRTSAVPVFPAILLEDNYLLDRERHNWEVPFYVATSSFLDDSVTVETELNQGKVIVSEWFRMDRPHFLVSGDLVFGMLGKFFLPLEGHEQTHMYDALHGKIIPYTTDFSVQYSEVKKLLEAIFNDINSGHLTISEPALDHLSHVKQRILKI